MYYGAEAANFLQGYTFRKALGTLFGNGNGQGNLAMPDVSEEGIQDECLVDLWGDACLSFKKGPNGSKGSKNVLLDNYFTFSDQPDERRPGRSLTDGLIISLRYKVNGYEKYGWIQTVITDNGVPSGESLGVPFNDYKRGYEYANPPFYYPTDHLNKGIQFLENGYMFFGDEPGRYYKNNNYYWRAELSLVGYKKGQWHHIETFRYGFEVRNDVVMPYKFQYGLKPEYNTLYINGLNK